MSLADYLQFVKAVNERLRDETIPFRPDKATLKRLRANNRHKIQTHYLGATEHCPCCGVKYDIDPDSPNLLTRDHIIPKCRGGKNNRENLRPMCMACNGLRAACGHCLGAMACVRAISSKSPPLRLPMASIALNKGMSKSFTYAYRFFDGVHCFSCRDEPGLLVSNPDLRTAIGMVPGVPVMAPDAIVKLIEGPPVIWAANGFVFNLE